MPLRYSTQRPDLTRNPRPFTAAVMPARKKTATATKSPVDAEAVTPQKPERIPAGADPAEVLAGRAITPEGFVVDKEKHLVIDRSVFDRSQFDEEQRGHIAAINYADQRLASLQQDLKTYQLGRDTMVQRLIESITELTPVAQFAAEG